MVEVTYIYRCGYCKKQKKEAFLTRIDVFRKPCLPPGWQEVNGTFVCEAHKVTVE